MFTIESWKEKAQAKLAQFGNWVDKRRRQDLPYVVYGTMAGLTIWPLVEEAVRTGQVAPVMGVAYTVVANIGTNLVANKIEEWKNQVEPPTEDDVIDWVAEQAAANPDLIPTLDKILEEFQTIAQTQANLAATEHAWFQQTLATELQRLDSGLTITVVSGAVAYGEGSTAVGDKGVNVDGNVDGDIITGKQTIVYAEKGAKVVIGDDEPVEMSAVERESALGRYLTHIIARNRYLQLQGIRSGGRLVNIELEHIYITLRSTQQRTVKAEDTWLAHESELAPGELKRRLGHETVTETVTVSVNEALQNHRRLVVLGDPGSGKTTLLRYLALLYAQDMAQGSGVVPTKLDLAESGHLPILLPLRQIGTFLKTHSDESVEGHALLLRFLHQSLNNERIAVPLDFFDAYLASGRAVILLDGLDEVAGSNLRRRVARLVEAFTRAYADCRLVVTSRIVGYTGAARLGEAYVTTTVRDFTLRDVERFLHHWHQLVAVGQMGPGPTAQNHAQKQTKQLLEAIQNNERIRELAINPLILTVLALVHRDRVKLPDRRSELYAEAIDVLLGKWDEARGVTEQPILDDKPFDAGDKRLMLQAVALHMHEERQKDIEVDALRRLLFDLFLEMVNDNRKAERAVNRFLQMIEERTGLLTARGEGVYAFSHLTFQEYLAALAVAARDDYVAYLLKNIGDSWWKEVVLLVAGFLSMLSKERTTRLIQAIADAKDEPEPYHNLVLAMECLRDAGENRVIGDLNTTLQQRLRHGLEAPPSLLSRWFKGRLASNAWIERRSAVVTALVRSGAGYWTQPYGEPEWVRIPAGEFVMGSDEGDDNEKPQHRLHIDEFFIARVPVTNAQYFLFVQATEQQMPSHWEDDRPPKHLESHPVTRVTWHDAIAYCDWLSQVTGKQIMLPSEAQWEKAARGSKDARVYPWGDAYDRLKCNGEELGIGTTTPIGVFPDGASPYGILDMSGNVWEWTSSLYEAYPYQTDDGREPQKANDDMSFVWRGGSFLFDKSWLRCSFRLWDDPYLRVSHLGFRVILSPFLPLTSDPSDL